MSLEPLNIKATHMQKPLKGSSLDLMYFKKIYRAFQELNSEAVTTEINSLVISPTDSAQVVEQYKKDIKANFALTIQIYTLTGEFHYSEDGAVLDETKLPTNIRMIALDNSVKFNNHFKYTPRNAFRLQFDFQKNQVFDLVTMPSEQTANTSMLTIQAGKESWASAVEKTVMDSLDDKKNGRDWLHARNIYDVFIFTVFFPLSFVVLYKIESSNLLAVLNSSKALTLAAYLYAFFLFLVLFRMIFNYARWIFPKFELAINSRRGSVRHRYVLGAIVVAISLALCTDWVKVLLVKMHLWPS